MIEQLILKWHISCVALCLLHHRNAHTGCAAAQRIAKASFTASSAHIKVSADQAAFVVWLYGVAVGKAFVISVSTAEYGLE